MPNLGPGYASSCHGVGQRYSHAAIFIIDLNTVYYRALQCFSFTPALPTSHSPWHPRSLHGIGQSDVIGPDIKLPLVDSNDPAQHRASVHAHMHVQVIVSVSGHSPTEGTVQS